MKKRLTKKFWLALVIFSLMGQVAWVVENMYFNVFIYKMFHASAADISRMVGLSSVAATVTTILMGAFTDYVGKRKVFICGGYLAWGVSILSFAFLRMDLLTPLAGSAVQAAALGVTLVIILDCVMTFLGSWANDACFNAWMTDWGDETNRGRIEGINSMMPLVGILVVFGGFSAFNLEEAASWTIIYTVVGGVVMLMGILGIFLIDEKPGLREDKAKIGYFQTLSYSFRPSVMKANPLLYAVIGAFAIFGISIQVFMPYLILYYEKSLGMTNYVFIMAPAIVLAAVITAFYGRTFDLLGFKSSVVPTVIFLSVGYILLYVGTDTGIVFVGSLFMMTGYLTGMAIFGAMIRTRIPAGKAGQFQGMRIIGQVLIPGMIGPAIGAAVLKNAELIENSDGTTSFLPNRNIFLAALVVALVLFLVLWSLFLVMRRAHYRLLSEGGEKLMEEWGMRGQKSASGGKHTEGQGAGPTVWSRYPRPQMQRDSFYSLNGVWKLKGKEILIPFPPQAQLSGYRGRVGSRLEYVRKFLVTGKGQGQEGEAFELEAGGRILLHFGAVDQVAEIFLNGHFIGKHEGGYLPFTFDITEHVNREGENRLVVKARDTLSHRYPYGKQRKARGGMWYTPVSGIWQSVWLERVPEVYIKNLRMKADTEGVTIEVASSLEASSLGCQNSGEAGREMLPLEIEITLHDGSCYKVAAADGRNGSSITKADGGRYKITVDMAGIRLSDGSRYQPRLWSTKDPYLYRVKVTMGEDCVSSYFGLRVIEIKQINGLPRVCLNHEPLFLNGVLDQGYFCDGIYLPANEEEYERDVLNMQELGINLLRKHIKIEPEWFYYYCDVHGMLVMQDMVNSGLYSWVKDTALPTLGYYQKGDGKIWGSKKRKKFFLEHMGETIMHLQNHPSVVAYTIFNEGWGQFDSDAMYEEARKVDDSRLYDAASGWFPRKKSDFDSQHIYFMSLKIPEHPKVPVLASECGGYSYAVPGHVYAKYSNYGYGGCADGHQLTEQIVKLYEDTILPGIQKGVCGSIYTQLSDVEDETNGFYTYDRKVCKVDKERIRSCLTSGFMV